MPPVVVCGRRSNPLRRGWRRAIIAANIKELRSAGYRRAQAVAIAIATARESFRNRYPRRRYPEHLQLPRSSKRNPAKRPFDKAAIRRQLGEMETRRYQARISELRADKRAADNQANAQLAKAQRACDAAKKRAYAAADAAYRRASERDRASGKAATKRRQAKRKADRERSRKRCAAARAAIEANRKRTKRHADQLIQEERQHRRDLAAIERGNRRRAREQAARRRATPAERRQESDDAVRAELPPELHPVWEVHKGSFRTTPHRSRAEAFLEWVEAEPEEVWATRVAVEPLDADFAREYEAWARGAA